MREPSMSEVPSVELMIVVRSNSAFVAILGIGEYYQQANSKRY
jgi:hypothetical protein